MKIICVAKLCGFSSTELGLREKSSFVTNTGKLVNFFMTIPLLKCLGIWNFRQISRGFTWRLPTWKFSVLISCIFNTMQRWCSTLFEHFLALAYFCWWKDENSFEHCESDSCRFLNLKQMICFIFSWRLSQKNKKVLNLLNQDQVKKKSY